MSEHPNEFAPESHEPLPTGWRVPVALLLLALPIIASMISRTVMSFVDFIMVSQLGTEAQAAIMPAGILLFCFVAFGMGSLTAVSTFVSQSLGRNDRQACGSYAWQGVHLSVLLGLLALPVWFVVPGLFAWVGHDPAVQEMEVAYVQIGLLGLAPMLAAHAVTNFFNGIHKPMVGFWAMVISNIFNVIANYALIFGNFGFPAMGIGGAAWATNLAAGLQLLIMLAWMLRPKLAAMFDTRHTWRPDLARMRRIIWVGVPAGMQFVVDIFAFTVFTLLLVGRFGTVQLAAHNLAFKFLEVAFMPAVGLGVAVTAAVGKAIGRGQPAYARLVTRWAAGFAIAYMGLIAMGYLLLRHELAGLLSDDPDVIRWAGQLLLLCAVFQVFDGLGITHISALRGAGDNHWPAWVAAIMAATVLIGGGYVAAWWWPQLGAVGPWIAATLYVCVLGLTLWARWTFGPWERIDLFNDEQTQADAPHEHIDP
ncbi:MATE family efflux transporter [Phycisphaerales bacterium AB-hyl4]|uniref:Multidrug-efflux transporter n=1 Tax=Natronomicrosphaera hydrolytica TaxID=3242702 RepID=A0ABV4U1L4_9BACT